MNDDEMEDCGNRAMRELYGCKNKPLSEDEERYICDWCGEPTTAKRPVREYVVSPPVDGYEVETGWFHADCADEATLHSIR